MDLLIETRETTGDDYESRDGIRIEVKTRFKTRSVSFFDGEAEDNALCRNFNDVYFIEDLIVAAYEAGTAGEEINIVHQ